MEFPRGNFGNDRQQDGQNSGHRHSSHQITRLEQFFLGCTNPDAKQREELGAELGLDPSQIKFWFQNKRTKEKSLNKRYDNNTLRAENQKIQAENRILRETLNNAYCPTCQGHPLESGEECHISIDKLRVENALLHQQIEKVSMLLAKNCGISSSDLSTLLPSQHGPSPSWRTPMAMMHSTSSLPSSQTCAPSSSSSSSRRSSVYQNIAATEPVPTFTLTPSHLDHDTPPPPPPPHSQ